MSKDTICGKKVENGKFYWVIIVNDPDVEESWETRPQPARFAGYLGLDDEPCWFYLGIEDLSYWPVKWVGDEILPPAP